MTQPQPARDPAAVLTAALRRHPYLLLAAACLPFAALNRPNGVDRACLPRSCCCWA